MEQRLSLVTLGVADLEAARRFYEGLGWTPVSGPDDVHFFQAGCMVVALWSLRTSVQAQADGVVLHAVLDLLAAVCAGTTAVLAVRLTRLLTPSAGTHREVLVAVR